MDYFKILKLNREPFSNSPEPDFFFAPPGQLAILQQLEIAIRLRRGLNVVMGEVGTGKSTLCRQLIIRLSESEEDRREIETSLILDPSFSTPHEFLNIVAGCFGFAEREEPVSEWKMKEEIKNALYQKGIVGKKIVVLIIDEGQKIPSFTLEIIREFLNYETNENKLLQIIIFAQNEFKETLAGIKNFADRVNRYHLLAPLNFRGTKGMIEFRLQRAAWPDHVPAFFTKPALLSIYLATGGFPRRIVTLCHHLLLALIIKNRRKAGWFFVYVNIVQMPFERFANIRWTKTATVLAAVLLIAFIMLALPSTPGNIFQIVFSAYHTEMPTKASPSAMPSSMREEPAGAFLTAEGMKKDITFEVKTEIPPEIPFVMPPSIRDEPAGTFSIEGKTKKDVNAAVEKDKRFIKLKRTWLREGPKL